MENVIDLDKHREKLVENVVTEEEIDNLEVMTKELVQEMRKDAARQGLYGAEAFLWSTHELPEIYEILSKMVEKIEEFYTPPSDNDNTIDTK